MYSNKQNARVLARGFFTNLGATPSKSFFSVNRAPSCLAIGFSLQPTQLLWKLICTWMLVLMISKGWVANVEITPALIPATTDDIPYFLPSSQRVQQRPAKQAYFQHEAAQPLKKPLIPSIFWIRYKFLIILPDHFSAPDNQYLASMTPRGLPTIALAILAKAEAVKFPTLFSGITFQIVLRRQKQTALLIPVLIVLTRSPLQNAVQPSSVRMQEKARQIFLRKLFDKVSLLGGTISAIFMLSRGWSTAAVVVPARYPQYPFFLPISIVDFNLIMLHQKVNIQSIAENNYKIVPHSSLPPTRLVDIYLKVTAKLQLRFCSIQFHQKKSSHNKQCRETNLDSKMRS